jgi:hypothetical protein
MRAPGKRFRALPLRGRGKPWAAQNASQDGEKDKNKTIFIFKLFVTLISVII